MPLSDLTMRSRGIARAPGPGSTRRRRRRRWAAGLSVLLVVVLLLPVPWLHVISDDPPGSAWRLDGRLEVNGQILDPAGDWSWLAVGRPQLVGEALWDRLVGTDDPPKDMRSGSVTTRPALSEPAAVAVGLLHAGWELDLGLLVEARSPRYEGYPERVLIEAIDGVPVTDRATWEQLSTRWKAPATPSPDGPALLGFDRPVLGSHRVAGSGADGAATGAPGAGGPTQIEQIEQIEEDLTFRIRDGRVFTAPGPGLPYDVIRLLDTAPQDLDAGITFGVTRYLPVDWFRNLSLGSSHGAMVALMTYASVSGRDVAQGRHVAGTGGITGDGAVTRIGGLPAKARAAARAGADVILVPTSQLHELDDVDLGNAEVVPWTTLRDGIDHLEQPRT